MLADVDRHQAEVGLIHDVQQPALGVERQIAGVAIFKIILIEFVNLPARAAREIHQPHAARISFRDVCRPVAGESHAHEYAAPVVGFFFLLAGLGAAQRDMAHGARALRVILQNGKRKLFRSAVHGDNGLAICAHGEAEWSGTRAVLLPQRHDHAAAGKDAGRARTANGGAVTGGRGVIGRC